MSNYIPESSYVKLGHRKELVQKMFALGRKLNQSALTLHLAVKLLDRVFSSCFNKEYNESQIRKESYDLIASGCLLLASKFEELDMNIPMIGDVQVATKFKQSYHMLKGIQNELLMILDFDLMALTPYHILN